LLSAHVTNGLNRPDLPLILPIRIWGEKLSFLIRAARLLIPFNVVPGPKQGVTRTPERYPCKFSARFLILPVMFVVRSVVKDFASFGPATLKMSSGKLS